MFLIILKIYITVLYNNIILTDNIVICITMNACFYIHLNLQ